MTSLRLPAPARPSLVRIVDRRAPGAGAPPLRPDGAATDQVGLGNVRPLNRGVAETAAHRVAPRVVSPEHALGGADCGRGFGGAARRSSLRRPRTSSRPPSSSRPSSRAGVSLLALAPPAGGSLRNRMTPLAFRRHREALMAWVRLDDHIDERRASRRRRPKRRTAISSPRSRTSKRSPPVTPDGPLTRHQDRQRPPHRGRPPPPSGRTRSAATTRNACRSPRTARKKTAPDAPSGANPTTPDDPAARHLARRRVCRARPRPDARPRVRTDPPRTVACRRRTSTRRWRGSPWRWTPRSAPASCCSPWRASPAGSPTPWSSTTSRACCARRRSTPDRRLRPPERSGARTLHVSGAPIPGSDRGGRAARRLRPAASRPHVRCSG